MTSNAEHLTVDLSTYPDLVVIMLGMRVRAFPGLKRLIGLGPQIENAGAGRPQGLLHYENNIIFRLFPLHVGMRWYWRDFDSMERWTRSEPHRKWWRDFVRDAGGTGFWHEVYFMRGGMEGGSPRRASFGAVPAGIGGPESAASGVKHIASQAEAAART